MPGKILVRFAPPLLPLSRLAASLVALSLFVGACETGITDPEDVIFPASNVSYSRHVQPLFDLGCAFSGCHSGADQAGGLSLASYFDVIQETGLVLPGDSSRSVLVQIVREKLPHSPLIRSIIDQDQARGIAVWVHEGASNN